MSSLADEIKETEGRIAHLDQDAAAEIRKVQTEAGDKILAVIKKTDALKAGLRLRLSHLKAAQAGETADPPFESAEASSNAVMLVEEAKPSAKELILTALRDRGPLSSNALDAVVMGAGWSKFAAEKAKTLSKRNELTTSDKRIWSITAKGKKEISQIGPKA